MEKQYSICYGHVARASKTQATDDEIREIRINGFGSPQEASASLAAMTRYWEHNDIRTVNPRIVGPDGAVFAVEE